nr:histidine triad nucleotide-binding protein [Actinomycetota bacterium]
MTDCLFCKIASKELDSQVVSESERVLAFEDINPAASTHVLVIPKEHIASAGELGAEHGELLAEMFATMGRIASERSLDGGYRIVTNVGADAGQSVHHLHFHLI